ncbi:MAG: hypothetical protein B7Y27_08950 [Hydrogenophilales bacterium 16-64-40]|nr:MAG: hypothetical protein B7Y27_08950 [Hydrogenophilales bacterium 16-64-40]
MRLNLILKDRNPTGTLKVSLTGAGVVSGCLLRDARRTGPAHNGGNASRQPGSFCQEAAMNTHPTLILTLIGPLALACGQLWYTGSQNGRLGRVR